jgi:hypothetical protein
VFELVRAYRVTNTGVISKGAKMSDYRKVKVVIVLIGSGGNMADEPEIMTATGQGDILVDIYLPLPELMKKFQKAVTRIEEGNDE